MVQESLIEGTKNLNSFIKKEFQILSSLDVPNPIWSTKNQPLASSFTSKASSLTSEARELESIVSEQDTSDLRG